MFSLVILKQDSAEYWEYWRQWDACVGPGPGSRINRNYQLRRLDVKGDDADS